MKILKVRETNVKIGSLSIKGLIDNDGKFYVGFPQICDQFEISKVHASRDFKALLGKDFEITKTRVEGTTGIKMTFLKKTHQETSKHCWVSI